MDITRQSGFEILGSDSFDVCRDEGYLIMSVKGHGTPGARYLLFESGYPEVSEKSPFAVRWTELTFDDFREIHKDNKKGIESFAGQSFDFDTMDEYGVLAFAQVAVQYTHVFGEQSFETVPRSFMADIKRLVKKRAKA